MRLRLGLCSFVLALFLPALSSASDVGRVFQGQVYVIDGDTFSLGERRVRLHGINAPESAQTCGVEQEEWGCGSAATQALRSLTQGQRVTCLSRDTDRYGRTVASCGTSIVPDLGAALVSQGLATAYTRYSQDYVPHERQAKAAGLGLWSGEFEDPEAYRHGSPSAYQPSASPSSSSQGFFGRMFDAWSDRRAQINAQPFPQQGYGYTTPEWMSDAPVDDGSERAVESEPFSSQVASDLYANAKGPGAGGLSEAQFCALASLARRPCAR